MLFGTKRQNNTETETCKNLGAGPWCRHQLDHGCVVRRVARVRHDELGFVLHEVGDLARNCAVQRLARLTMTNNEYKATDAGGGGAQDGLGANQLVHLAPHLPLEVEHLGHALLHVLRPSDTLCQACRPTRRYVENGEPESLVDIFYIKDKIHK